MSAVRITRSRITTCSMSKTVIAKGERVSNKAWVMPGVSIPERSMRPVKASLWIGLSLGTGADYREIRYLGAEFPEFTA